MSVQFRTAGYLNCGFTEELRVRISHRHKRPALFMGLFVFLFLWSNPLPAQNGSNFTVQKPRVALANIAFSVTIEPGIAYYVASGDTAAGPVFYRVTEPGSGRVFKSGEFIPKPLTPEKLVISGLKFRETGVKKLQISLGTAQTEIRMRVIPAFLSLLPPLLAIFLALVTRQVIVALFFGIWLGVFFIYEFNPFLGLLHTLDEYLVNAVWDREHVLILMFSLMLGGMVGAISKSGGTQGIVEKLALYARDARGGQFATWLMGILIFFDDYANTLIVGNTMRPLADRLRISREKLSYLVDSTAAPVANIAIISTWIGYEVSLISQSFETHGIARNAYITFIETIPYNFYPIFTLLMGLLVALLLRDFGPMLHAERRCRATGQVLSDNAVPLADLASSELMADEDTPKRWYNAMVPVLVVIAVVGAGLFYTGWSAGLETLAQELAAEGKTLREAGLVRRVSAVVGAADSFSVLMWASFAGGLVAIIMALWQRLLTLHKALDAWIGGIRSMMMACVILTAAWAIGDICGDLFTADYVVHLTETFLSPEWLPFLIFLSAGVIAFATGTSWGTMAILMPIAIPLAYKFPQDVPGIDEAHATALLLSTTAAVLAGATFGDHCSPISDTTILSSMATGADHIDHVRTQLPYAATAGAVACVFGYLPVGFGFNNWVGLSLGAVTVYLIVRYVGKRADGPE